MATEVGALIINLQMDVARLRADVESGKNIINRGMSSIESTIGRARNMLSMLGVGLSAGAFIGFIKGAVNMLDALNDASDATGTTVEKLSALEDVARRNGGTLDTVTSALVKLNKGLNEGVKSDTANALKAIGLSAADLAKLDPADALLKIAQALSKYENDGNKARIVQEIFGKSIREMAPFLKDVAEAGELNATATAHQAAEAEKFNKNMYALETSLGNVGRSIANAVVPAINQMIERWGRATEAGQGFIEKMQSALNMSHGQLNFADPWTSKSKIEADIAMLESGKGGTNAKFNERRLRQLKLDLTEVNLLIDQYQRKANAMENGLDGAPLKAPSIAGGAQNGRDPFAEMMKALRGDVASAEADASARTGGEALTTVQKRYTEFLASIQNGDLKLTPAQIGEAAIQWDKLLRADQAIEESKKAIKATEDAKRAAEVISSLGQKYDQANDTKAEAMQVMSAEERALAEELRKVDEQAQAARESLAKMEDLDPSVLADKLAEVNAALERQREIVTRLAEEQERLNASWQYGATQALQEYADNAKNVAGNVKDVFTHAFDGMADALTDFAMTGKMDFKSLMESIVRDLVRMQMQAATNQIFQAIAGAIGGAMSGTEWYQSTQPSVPDGSSVVDMGGSLMSGGGAAAMAPAAASATGAAMMAPASVNVNPIVYNNVGGDVTATMTTEDDGRGGLDMVVMLDRAGAQNNMTHGSASNRSLRQMGVKPPLDRR